MIKLVRWNSFVEFRKLLVSMILNTMDEIFEKFRVENVKEFSAFFTCQLSSLLASNPSEMRRTFTAPSTLNFTKISVYSCRECVLVVCLCNLIFIYDSRPLSPLSLKSIKDRKTFLWLSAGMVSLIIQIFILLLALLLCLYSEFSLLLRRCAEMSAIQIIDWGGCVFLFSRPTEQIQMRNLELSSKAEKANFYEVERKFRWSSRKTEMLK